MSQIAALPLYASAIFLGLFVSAAQAQERVSCWNSGPNSETCRIEQPNVRRSITDYPQIRFREGDIVTVSAGGCVQTGGSGATWKRYVDPQGRNADRLYSGLIYLPGLAINDEAQTREELLTPIRDVIGIAIKVTSHCPARADCPPTRPGTDIGYLSLGYKDDDYGDNGYWGHDDGTGNQCRGVGPAWIVLVIKHSQPQYSGTANRTAPPVYGYPTNSRESWPPVIQRPNSSAGRELITIACQEVSRDSQENPDCNYIRGEILHDSKSMQMIEDKMPNLPTGRRITWENESGRSYTLEALSDATDTVTPTFGERICRDISISTTIERKTFITMWKLCKDPFGSWTFWNWR